VITHALPDLFHEFEPEIRAKFLFVFHNIIEYGNNIEKQGIFPLFAHNIAIGGKYFDAIRPICRKFS
jgi:dimeric dUTPase (all-alpha-NTP-PPase superfamily)